MNNNIPFEILNLIFSYVPRSETIKIINDKIKHYERFRDEYDDELTFSNFCLTYKISDKGLDDHFNQIYGGYIENEDDFVDDEDDEFENEYENYMEDQIERYYS